MATEETTLDRVGNREYHQDRTGAERVYTLANPANEYATIGPEGAPAAVEYDEVGNLSVDEAGRHYDYDERNRLLEVRAADDSTVLAHFGYDALGRRIMSAIPPSPGAEPVVTHYYYDGANVIEEYDVDANGDETRVRYHIHGGQYIDERVATVEPPAGGGGGGGEVPAGTVTYYLPGGSFSIIGTADADGVLPARRLSGQLT